jgi:hypothetical protein
MRRKLGLFLVFGAMLPLAAASVAWACGTLATLKLDAKVASPGQTLTATGKNYSAAAGASVVTLSLKSRSGQVLTTTPAAADGKINQTFSLPSSLSPGWYVVIATQFNANGTPKTGTPGRTTLRVQGTGAGAAVSPWSSSQPTIGGGSGSQPIGTMLLAAIVSLAMLAGGWLLVGRRSRTVRSEPQFGV